MGVRVVCRCRFSLLNYMLNFMKHTTMCCLVAFLQADLGAPRRPPAREAALGSCARDELKDASAVGSILEKSGTTGIRDPENEEYTCCCVADSQIVDDTYHKLKT